MKKYMWVLEKDLISSLYNNENIYIKNAVVKVVLQYSNSKGILNILFISIDISKLFFFFFVEIH